MPFSLSRRELLAGSAGLALFRAAPALPIESFRIVHMTDFHVQPELQAARGMEKALVHAMGQKPDLVLAGGDLIMDGLSVDEDRAKKQWAIYNRILKAHVSVPVHSAIGNHDAWGWNPKSGTTGREPKWGKIWWKEATQSTDTHYTFDFRGWRFIVIDTVGHTPGSWEGTVDPNQLEWLTDVLKSTPATMPVLVMGHVPVISVTPMMTSWNDSHKEWEYGNLSQVRENVAIKNLFLQHPNVKICLSGHTHMVDRVDYNGVSYLCGGAVCGAWWLGRHQDFDPGYQVIDLFPDGTFKREYVAWGWTAGA